MKTLMNENNIYQIGSKEKNRAFDVFNLLGKQASSGLKLVFPETTSTEKLAANALLIAILHLNITTVIIYFISNKL